MGGQEEHPAAGTFAAADQADRRAGQEGGGGLGELGQSVKEAVTGHDAVVAAIAGGDRLVPRSARALLETLPLAGVSRLVFLGGGGSLEYAPGHRFADSPDFPPQYLQTARDQAEALATCARRRPPSPGRM